MPDRVRMHRRCSALYFFSNTWIKEEASRAHLGNDWDVSQALIQSLLQLLDLQLIPTQLL